MRLFKTLLLLLALALSPAQAYNYSWSTHEDPIAPQPPNNPGECKGSECEGKPDCNRKGSPVYLNTGHFTWEETDISLEGTPLIELNRNYTSHEPRSGLFGNGWISNLERALIKTVYTYPVVATVSSGGSSSNGTVTVVETPTPLVYYVFRHPNGLRYTFKADENGTIQAPKGMFESIETTGSEAYTFNYPDGSKEFYQNGNLISRVDRNNNKVDLVYDNNGLLQQINDGKGRSLNFYYNSQGYVAQVSDHSGRAWYYDYDGAGNLLAVTDPLGAARNFQYADYKPTYDAQHYSHITKITDESGRDVTNVTYSGETVKTYTEGENRYTYSFNMASHYATKVDSAGSNYSFNWDTNGLVTRRSDPLGKFMTFPRDANLSGLGYTDKAGKTWAKTVDSIGRIVTATAPNGEVTSYTYSGKNPYPSIITSASGQETSIKYDEKFNPISIQDALGNTRTITYNAQGKPATITDEKGNTSSLTYDANGQATKITDAEGGVTSVEYDNLGRAISLIDANGNKTSFEYDAVDNVTKMTNALGHVTSYTYDEMGRTLSETDPIGNKATYTYDQYGRLQTSTLNQSQVDYTYYVNNKVKTVSVNNGTSASFTYDANRQIKTVSDNEGNVETYTYDVKGNLTGSQTTDSSGKIYEKSTGIFDAVNQLAQFTDGESGNSSFTYDLEGNMLSGNDALNRTTAYTYDALNRLLKTTDALSNVTTMSYDETSNLTDITSANGSVTSYQYDKINQVIKRISPDTGTTNYSYDAAGNLVQSIDANSDTMSLTYDKLNRVSTKSFSDSSLNVNYGYDENGAIGQLTSVTHSSGTTNYNYDALGNPLSEVNVIDGSTYTTAYEYDNLERPVKMTYPNGTIVEYSYDKNNIASLSINGSPFVTSVGYNADLMTSMSFANGVTDTIAYNKKSDPTNLSMAGESYTYTYDAVGNIKQISAQDTQTYNYDAVDRLIGTTDTNPLISDQAFAYDPATNRVSMTSDISSTYNYQANSNKLTSVDGNAHTYDNNGNLLSDGINTYTYDQRNRLTSLNATNYEYNDRNLRVRKQNSSENSVYVYNLSDQLISETNLNTNITKEYVYLAGVPVAYLSTGVTYAVHTDHLGTPRYLTDASKTIVWRWRSAAFGETKADEDPDQDGSTLDYKLRFAGQYYDNESGLHYNHNRYYNPTTGRYLTSDPIGLEAGLNTYAYVDANPLAWIDPLGLSKKKCKKECDKDDGFDPWELVPLYSCLTNPSLFNCATEIPFLKPLKFGKMAYKAGKAGSGAGKGGRGGRGGNGQKKKNCGKDGGPHSDTTKPKGDGKDSHHMPDRNADPSVSANDGPAIKMDPADHHKTSSNGRNGNKGKKYRKETADMIANGKYRDAMAREVWDVRKAAREASGNQRKYNKAMQQMLDYAKKSGQLPPK